MDSYKKYTYDVVPRDLGPSASSFELLSPLGPKLVDGAAETAYAIRKRMGLEPEVGMVDLVLRSVRHDQPSEAELVSGFKTAIAVAHFWHLSQIRVELFSQANRLLTLVDLFGEAGELIEEDDPIDSCIEALDVILCCNWVRLAWRAGGTGHDGVAGSPGGYVAPHILAGRLANSAKKWERYSGGQPDEKTVAAVAETCSLIEAYASFSTGTVGRASIWQLAQWKLQAVFSRKGWPAFRTYP